MSKPIYGELWDTIIDSAVVRPAEDADGEIFKRLYAQHTGAPVPAPLAQPARPDTRKLTCLACGAPASPHAFDHDVQITIPAR